MVESWREEKEGGVHFLFCLFVVVFCFFFFSSFLFSNFSYSTAGCRVRAWNHPCKLQSIIQAIYLNDRNNWA